MFVLGCGASRAPDAPSTPLTPPPGSDVPRANDIVSGERAAFLSDAVAEREALEASCRTDREACDALAEHALGLPARFPSDRMRAAEVYGASCDAGDLEACGPAGRILLKRGRTPERLARAAEHLDRACTNRDAALCYVAGVERLPNGRLLPDRDRAATQLRAACRLGRHTACVSLLTASESGLVPRVSAEEVDAFFALGRADEARRQPPSVRAASLRARCGIRTSPETTYAELVASLESTSPSDGVIVASRLPPAARRAVECTLEGAYGDVAEQSQPRLRFVRALAPLAEGGFDVFVEWVAAEASGRPMPSLYASRVHVTRGSFRVLEHVSFPIESPYPDFGLVQHETRLDVDGDGRRDVLVLYGDDFEDVITERLVVAPSRGGTLFDIAVPHGQNETFEGCFLTGTDSPVLAMLRARRDPTYGYGSSCLALLDFPRDEAPSLRPLEADVGPPLRLGGEDPELPTLPPGGTHVTRPSAFDMALAAPTVTPSTTGAIAIRAPYYGFDDERGFDRDARAFPFAMCPSNPVFLLRGRSETRDYEGTTGRVVSNVRIGAPNGSIGPAIPESDLTCETHDE